MATALEITLTVTSIGLATAAVLWWTRRGK